MTKFYSFNEFKNIMSETFSGTVVSDIMFDIIEYMPLDKDEWHDALEKGEEAFARLCEGRVYYMDKENECKKFVINWKFISRYFQFPEYMKELAELRLIERLCNEISCEDGDGYDRALYPSEIEKFISSKFAPVTYDMIRRTTFWRTDFTIASCPFLDNQEAFMQAVYDTCDKFLVTNWQKKTKKARG